MERKIIITKDGSHTVSIPGMNVTYHSIHGAIQESMHVFIKAGFQRGAGDQASSVDSLIRILEIGFGTGLNALLTLLEADHSQQHIHYTAIELFPLSHEEVKTLNYCEQLGKPGHRPLFDKIHHCEWENDIPVTPFFTIHKVNSDFISWSTDHLFDLVYYDAFAPGAQPELWTTAIFEKLYNLLLMEGMLVTYCSKGDVRRAMQAAGFIIEKIPGPPGKREMLRARKVRSHS